MWVGNEDRNKTTIITYSGPTKPEHTNFAAVHITFQSDFDIESLPKSVRAYPAMTIDCTPRAKNSKNETGIKRLRRILKALEGRNVKILMPFTNSITQEEFFARYA
jgi:hypothetical protein